MRLGGSNIESKKLEIAKFAEWLLSIGDRSSKGNSVCQSDEDCEIQSDWFTPEFLNEVTCSGIPNHRLILKVGLPVMLMRNIGHTTGLCNGTRLMVDHLGNNVISATVLTGKNIGDKVFIPRMNLIQSDPGLPFKFKRRQFPLTNCFTCWYVSP